MSAKATKAGTLPEHYLEPSGTWPAGVRRQVARALIADDDPQLLRALARILRDAGLEVQAADSCPEALELVKRYSFDVIVTDLFMPDMSGTQILAMARANDPCLPVVMISGDADMRGWLDELDDHSLYFLAKPFSGQDLCHLIRRIVGLPDNHRAAQ
jgi:two-component system, NtrC family, C4-dicarboxylate transport response regulator DctD